MDDRSETGAPVQGGRGLELSGFDRAGVGVLLTLLKKNGERLFIF